MASPPDLRTPEDELLALDGPPEVAPNLTPTVDAAVPLATYPDWDPRATRVIACRIGNDIYPGPRYESRDAARAAIEAQYGRVLEANYVPGRAFFRVRRP